MKPYVDQKLCIGCGLCASICPEVFFEEDEEKSIVIGEIKEENEEAVYKAMEECPAAAISEE